MADDVSDTTQPLAEDSILALQADELHLKAMKQSACRAKADGIIKANVVQAMTMGLIPVPLLDIVALTNIQFKMVDDLVKLYGIYYTHVEKSVVRSFVLGALPVVAVTGLSSALKVIPGIGSFVGSAGVAVSAGGLTYATGGVFAHHFEAGGNLNDFDMRAAKQQFMKEFRHGKKAAHQQISKPPLLSTQKIPD